MKSLKRKSKEERDIETRERRRNKEVIPLLVRRYKKRGIDRV